MSGGASVIRINLLDGGTDTFEFGPEDWVFRPGGHDLAISPPLPLDKRVHKVEAICSGVLLTENDMAWHQI